MLPNSRNTTYGSGSHVRSADLNDLQDVIIAGEHANTVYMSGVISPPALASGTTNNFNPTGLASATVLRIATDAGGSALGGLATGMAGRFVMLVNLGASGNLTLQHEGEDSDAANRFALVNEGNQAIRPGGGALLWYDGDSSRWRVIGVNA